MSHFSCWLSGASSVHTGRPLFFVRCRYCGSVFGNLTNFPPSIADEHCKYAYDECDCPVSLDAGFYAFIERVRSKGARAIDEPGEWDGDPGDEDDGARRTTHPRITVNIVIPVFERRLVFTHALDPGSCP